MGPLEVSKITISSLSMMLKMCLKISLVAEIPSLISLMTVKMMMSSVILVLVALEAWEVLAVWEAAEAETKGNNNSNSNNKE